MRSRPQRERDRKGPAAVIAGGFGEVLVTLGVVVLLFVVWELWWTNIDATREQESLTSQTLQDFHEGAPNPGPLDSAEASAADRARYGPPPEATLDGDGTFGVLYVPRFGNDYARPITEGVGNDVLDHLGIGHYPGTQMPGEVGNFAVAAHRQTHGEVFWDIDKLTVGDYLYVQTWEGYYTYRYRNTEVVDPGEAAVLLPVPHQPGQQAAESLLTMTSCHPPFTTRMRIIAYSELESWRPASAGPPAPIATTSDQANNG